MRFYSNLNLLRFRLSYKPPLVLRRSRVPASAHTPPTKMAALVSRDKRRICNGKLCMERERGCMRTKQDATGVVNCTKRVVPPLPLFRSLLSFFNTTALSCILNTLSGVSYHRSVERCSNARLCKSTFYSFLLPQVSRKRKGEEEGDKAQVGTQPTLQSMLDECRVWSFQKNRLKGRLSDWQKI